MSGLSYLKRVIDYSLCRRNTRNVASDSGIAFRVSGFLNVRAFSSVEEVERGNGPKNDEVKLNSVHCLLNEYGFTHEQITRVFKGSPSTLSAYVETLSPKLAFLRSILGSDYEVARAVAIHPRVLASSLKNQLMPNYNFIKSILGIDELVAKSVARSPRILCMEIENNLAAKVSFLRSHGLSDASIVKLMGYAPGIFALSFSKLEESLKKAMAFGIEPSKPMIVSAIRAICQINELNWDRKVELFRKWGWSNDDFLLAFKKQPYLMCISEEKINKGMDVFLNTVGLSSSDIVKYPYIIFLSLEERIIPRCSVLALLHTKGVLGDKPPTASTYVKALCLKETSFVEKFVDKYPEHVLELWLKLRRKPAV